MFEMLLFYRENPKFNCNSNWLKVMLKISVIPEVVNLEGVTGNLKFVSYEI